MPARRRWVTATDATGEEPASRPAAAIAAAVVISADVSLPLGCGKVSERATSGARQEQCPGERASERPGARSAPCLSPIPPCPIGIGTRRGGFSHARPRTGSSGHGPRGRACGSGSRICRCSRRSGRRRGSFRRIDEEGVLEAVFPGRRRLAVAGEQVPVVVVQVHHVGDAGAVEDLPGLGRAELREGVGAGGVEGPAVDQPGGLEEAADRDLPAVVGPAPSALPASSSGSGRRRRGMRVRSGTRSEPTRNCISAPT